MKHRQVQISDRNNIDDDELLKRFINVNDAESSINESEMWLRTGINILKSYATRAQRNC